jgi:transcriptional regulator with XRE-family HTH domain
MEQSTERPSGLGLRRLRVRQGESQTAIARIWGVAPQRISNIEAQRRVSHEAAARYRAALETLAALGTSGPDEAPIERARELVAEAARLIEQPFVDASGELHE